MVTNGKMQLYPMLRIALFLVLGIFLGHEMMLLLTPSVWLGGAVVAVVFSLFLFRFPIIQTSLLLLTVMLVGAFLVSRQEMRLSFVSDGEKEVYRAVLVSQPVERGKVIRTDLRVLDGSFAGRLVKASILRDTVECRYNTLNVGDGIVVRSVMDAPRRFRESNFDYPLYLRCHGVSAVTFVYWDSWMKETVSLHSMSLVERTRLRALMFRRRLLSSLSLFEINEENMAVLSAMALGEKSGLSADIKDLYSLSGASHILALSGLHIGIIYALFLLIFRFRRFRFLQELLVLVLIWTFAFIVGLTPSVVRASMMVTLYSLIGLLNRDRFSLNTLGATAFIMLLVNPLSLYDVGFELSFVSVFFILLLFKPVYSLLPFSFLERHRIIRWFWSITVLSCVAQLGTAPLVAYYFGRIPVYFLLTNWVVMLVAPAVLYTFFTLMLFSFLPFVQGVLSTILSTLLTLQNTSLRWIVALPGAQQGEVHINAVQLALAYFLIAGACFIVWKLRKSSVL